MSEIPEKALSALKSGKKIEAIKITRAELNIHLKDAKELVDAYIEETPTAYNATAESHDNGGFGISLAVFLLIAAGLAYWLTSS